MGNAALMALVLAALASLIALAMDRMYVDEAAEHLRAQATTVRQWVGDRFDLTHQAELDDLAKRLAAAQPDAVRYTLILTDGTVLADSESQPVTMESHAGRPEVRDALQTGWGSDTRFSSTVAQRLMYVAVRVGEAHPVGVVRVAMPLRTITEHAQAFHRLIWRCTGVGLVAVLVLALGLARVWSMPIRRLTSTARRLSQGDLTARMPVTGRDELSALARSINQMRDHHVSHLHTIDRQRRTLESLLAQLNEGVVAAAPGGRIVLMNPAAMRLLSIPESLATEVGWLEGQIIERCITSHDLQSLLLPTAGHIPGASDRPPDLGDRRSPQEIRLQIEGPDGERHLLARGEDILLPPSDPQQELLAASPSLVPGRLVVLTDITDLTRTMQIKADFAVNASHELRTPVSAIRAAIETLLQLDPVKDVEDLRHFLSVVDRQSERMAAMVGDLLDLSRIESARSRFEPVAISIRELLGNLEARFREPIKSKGLGWETSVEEPLSTVVANSYLLGLVLSNLVDNAIKFTDSGGRIRVAFRTANETEPNSPSMVIEVADTGCGIPESEQPRVFERFYQVARARSGSMRGTGLGLSIVRHAVGAMQGTVDLQSQVGQGTRIAVTLPMRSTCQS
ncbi:MAG: HAMP domain-containing protein [Phycisphaerae bacterium]|nr:HAMP domain-containing protein [Phycisphaerae bacterium]